MSGAVTASPRFAERYDSVLVPVIFRPWARELIRRAIPINDKHVLDLGCGTGAVSRELVYQGHFPASLTGADYNPDMLAVARVRAREIDLPSSWVLADAQTLPFKDSQFDIVLCQQALQFFPDRSRALNELLRVMKPGGRAVFCICTDLALNPVLRAEAETLDRYIGPHAGNAIRAICGLPDGPEIRDLFVEVGFRDVTLECTSLLLTHPDGRTFAKGALGGMHTGDKLTEMTEDKREACINDFLNGMREFFDGTALNFPHVSNVVTARA